MGFKELYPGDYTQGIHRVQISKYFVFYNLDNSANSYQTTDNLEPLIHEIINSDKEK